MTRERHLTDAEWVAASLRPPRRLSPPAQSHLGRCRGCRADLEAISRLRDHLAGAAEEPSPGALMRVWAMLPPAPPRPRELSRFAVARLIRDSGALPAVAGVRTPFDARRLLWRIPGAELDLQLEPPGLGTPARITGQILPLGRRETTTRGGSVWLLERGRPAQWSPIGSDGAIALPAPRARHAHLWIEWGTVRGRVDLP